jgi:hypothetical protein
MYKIFWKLDLFLSSGVGGWDDSAEPVMPLFHEVCGALANRSFKFSTRWFRQALEDIKK